MPRAWRGKEYTAYEATQKQRQMETSMRAQRQKVRCLKEGGANPDDIVIEKARYQGQLQEYKRFCNDMGLTPQMERVYIDGLGRVAPGSIGLVTRTSNRKTKNQGAFVVLEIPMQKRAVIQTARKYGVDLKGITIKIQRSEALLALSICGSADPKNIGRIDLFPKAFATEEELVKTLLHETCHVKQYQKYGGMYTQNNRAKMEKIAYRYEDLWYNFIKRRK